MARAAYQKSLSYADHPVAETAAMGGLGGLYVSRSDFAELYLMEGDLDRAELEFRKTAEIIDDHISRRENCNTPQPVIPILVRERQRYCHIKLVDIYKKKSNLAEAETHLHKALEITMRLLQESWSEKEGRNLTALNAAIKKLDEFNSMPKY